MSIVRIGLAETKKFAEGYTSIFGPKKKEGEKPAFYISEESQQCKFVCEACEEFNDILGRFGYCSHCGARNDLQDFLNSSVSSIRDRMTAGGRPEDGVRDAVSAFESMVGQFARQLAELATLSKKRKSRLTTSHLKLLIKAT